MSSGPDLEELLLQASIIGSRHMNMAGESTNFPMWQKGFYFLKGFDILTDDNGPLKDAKIEVISSQNHN